MRVSILAASVLCIALLTGAGQAQVPATSSSPPLPALGFMPPYEITRTVRRAGFDPLAPPLREGSTYVVRATDFRGILMRVVVDARSGAIRDANRIVPGPGSYGSQAGMVPYEGMLPYESSPDDMPTPHGRPAAADYDAPPVAPLDDDGEILAPRPPAVHPLTRASVIVLPPLPRPRPPELASRKPIDDIPPVAAKPAAVSDSKPAAEAKSGKPQTKSEVTGSAPVAALAGPAAAPQAVTPAPSAPPATVAAKPGKSLQAPAIND